MTPALKALLFAPRPLIDLNFADGVVRVGNFADSNPARMPGWSFARASVGTATDLAGNVIQFASGEPRITNRGLLIEEARTNLLLNSATMATQSATVTAAAHTLSFTGTGSITLTGTSTAGPLVGTGANDRVTLSFTPTAGSLTLTVSGDVRMAQLELGAFVTSWIPTVGSTVTRAADDARITPFVTPASVTLAITWQTANPAAYTLLDGLSTANRMLLSRSTVQVYFEKAGVGQQSTVIVGITSARQRAAGRWSSAGNTLAHNGVVSGTGSTTTVVPWDSIYLGRTQSGSLNVNGYIERVRVLPYAATDAELVTLSTL